MADDSLPRHFQELKRDYPAVLAALEELGRSTRGAGPIAAKQAHLIQLAASAAIQSEGAVHSHTRRALEAGASPAEVRHAVLLLVSTIGFPRTAAALSWTDDILNRRD